MSSVIAFLCNLSLVLQKADSILVKFLLFSDRRLLTYLFSVQCVSSYIQYFYLINTSLKLLGPYLCWVTPSLLLQHFHTVVSEPFDSISDFFFFFGAVILMLQSRTPHVLYITNLLTWVIAEEKTSLEENMLQYVAVHWMLPRLWVSPSDDCVMSACSRSPSNSQCGNLASSWSQLIQA